MRSPGIYHNKQNHPKPRINGDIAIFPSNYIPLEFQKKRVGFNQPPSTVVQKRTSNALLLLLSTPSAGTTTVLVPFAHSHERMLRGGDGVNGVMVSQLLFLMMDTF